LNGLGVSGLDSRSIKKWLIDLGADLYGIASQERFNGAPKGSHPTDIVENCRSVIVFAKKMPAELLFEDSNDRYCQINNQVTLETDKLALECASELVKEGIGATAIIFSGSQERSASKKTLSMKQAGYVAGLGIIGKNTLLMNQDFGNMIRIGAILIDLELESDPLAQYEGCPPGCELCIQTCPQQALDGGNVNPVRCIPVIKCESEAGIVLKKCSICRRVCPNSLGIKNELDPIHGSGISPQIDIAIPQNIG
jgi:epoxyqueuosine reductase